MIIDEVIKKHKSKIEEICTFNLKNKKYVDLYKKNRVELLIKKIAFDVRNETLKESVEMIKSKMFK